MSMRASFLGWIIGSLMSLVSLGAQAGENVLDRIQLLRSESFRACASILLSYDPYARTFDRAETDSYQSSLEKMAEVVSSPDLAGVKEEYSSFSSSIKALESSTQDASVFSVNDVLVAQARLIAAADKLYSWYFSDGNTVKRKLHELSLEKSKLLVIYQARPYGGVVNYPGVLLDENTLPSMDALITSDLEVLRKSIPESALELDDIQRSYAFVRPRILDVRKKFVADGVKYYLGRNIDRLDAIASKL
ncbi:hypothetical protein ACFPTX_16120 [Pseudomonas sp. GCM10022188]|uniref:hypothetical protein n=1 Tax=Pseudomonas TaxID=286 RepID=UPI001E3D548A|nr:hypothetical protein [Pseudomonas oryzagri]MCC6076051.1 hypothetical protein [Pseudomonas oryzagri]